MKKKIKKNKEEEEWEKNDENYAWPLFIPFYYESDHKTQKKKEIRLVSCNIYTIHWIFKGEKESFWHRDWLFAKRKEYIDIFKQLALNDTLCQETRRVSFNRQEAYHYFDYIFFYKVNVYTLLKVAIESLV